MFRVPRQQLNEAIEAFLLAAASCTNTRGLKVVFMPTPEQAEGALLGALSWLAHPHGPVSPSDIYFVGMAADGKWESWPKPVDKP